ncbi:MAG: ribosome biogenesis GTPase Der [Candidatus Eisenbacteria bacterium]
MRHPVVAIIGRPNVGKSTLFNRILGERIAVVDDRPGVTKDRHFARADWNGRSFMLVDTGGFLPEIAEGIEAVVRRQAEMALDACSVALFVADAKTGITDLDGAIARLLLKRARPAILVVNKADNPRIPVESEFWRLGLGDPMPISSEQGTGIGDLLDQVVALLPPPGDEEEDDGAIRVAIVGRPNVGKSSLVNALLHEERMVVDARPGTTVDAIDSELLAAEGRFILVDTAGLRHEAKFAEDAEFYATLRTIRAVERADVVTVMLEGDAGMMRQDVRVIAAAQEASKPVLLAYNKWDLVSDKGNRWDELDEQRGERYPTLARLPRIAISALDRTRLSRLPLLWKELHTENTKRVPTHVLNEWLKKVQAEKAPPATRVGRPARIYYMTQAATAPPRFVIFASQPEAVNKSYHRFLLNRLRDEFGYAAASVRLEVKKSE